MDFFGVSGDQILDLVSHTLSQQVVQFSIAFGLAAWFHARQVRKEIKDQFEHLTGAIEGVARALKEDLYVLTVRIAKMEGDMEQLRTYIKRGVNDENALNGH